jgi:hypothetical protein
LESLSRSESGEKAVVLSDVGNMCSEADGVDLLLVDGNRPRNVSLMG